MTMTFARVSAFLGSILVAGGAPAIMPAGPASMVGWACAFFAGWLWGDWMRWRMS